LVYSFAREIDFSFFLCLALYFFDFQPQFPFRHVVNFFTWPRILPLFRSSKTFSYRKQTCPPLLLKVGRFPMHSFFSSFLILSFFFFFSIPSLSNLGKAGASLFGRSETFFYLFYLGARWSLPLFFFFLLVFLLLQKS